MLALALAACADDAPAACAPPALDAPWLPSLLSDTVARLASAPRFLPTEREAARAYLASELTALGLSPELHDYPGGRNVHATIPATQGDGPRIVVGAHFDTVDGSPGANDNATGAAAVLAVARFVTEAPCRTAPVTVAFFDQEELGLFGARAFAATLSPSAVRAVHTIDQVAWDADGDRRFELERPTAALEAEWRAAAAAVGVPVAVTATGGTDHQAFRQAGFAAVGLTEEYAGGDTSPHRHLASDTAASVDAAYLVLAAQLAARVILDEVSP
jgi:Zn-dependent M28 family amino/carboxypeptidase